MGVLDIQLHLIPAPWKDRLIHFTHTGVRQSENRSSPSKEISDDGKAAVLALVSLLGGSDCGTDFHLFINGLDDGGPGSANFFIETRL